MKTTPKKFCFFVNQKKIHDLAYPIFLSNQDLCPKTTLVTGMYTVTLGVLREFYQEAAKNLIDLGDDVQIWKLVKNAPAKRAGTHQHVSAVPKCSQVEITVITVSQRFL